MRPSTSPRQMQLLRFIRGYQLAKGYSPSFREMAEGIGLSPRAKARVFDLLANLENRGLVRRLYGRARAVYLVARPSIPRAPDGAPLFEVVSFREAR